MEEGNQGPQDSPGCEIDKKHGFDIAAFSIPGFPEETLETIQDTIDLSMELPIAEETFA